MPSKKIVRFKDFLVNFEDVRAPNEFSGDWVHKVLFSSNPQMLTPDANRDSLDGSIFQYFFAISDDWLRVKGATTDWVHSGMNHRDIPQRHRVLVRALGGGRAARRFGSVELALPQPHTGQPVAALHAG